MPAVKYGKGWAMTVAKLRQKSLRNMIQWPWHIFRFLLIGLKFHTCKLVSNWIDSKEGIMEYRIGKLYGRGILEYMKHGVEVIGAENVPLEGYYCVASNHASYLDWAVLLSDFPTYLRFIAKKELTHIPVIGSHLAKRGVLIDRKGRKSAMEAIEAAILDKNQVPILIFPEGTRSIDGQPKRFKKGGLGLFIKHNVPILPVTVTGTHEHLPRDAMAFKPRGQFKLVIGHLVRPEDFKGEDEVVSEVQRVVHQTFSQYSASKTVQHENAKESKTA